MIQSQLPADCYPQGVGKGLLEDDIHLILGKHPAIWRHLAGKSLFITGGTGWFGRWLLESIAVANQRLGADIRVTLLSRSPGAFVRQAPLLSSAPFLTLLEGNVRNFAFPKARFTHVIHAATTSARETFSGESGLAKFDTLVEGTRRVLDFAAACGAENVLFTSSGVAYGALPASTHHREDAPTAPDTCDPETALGQAKRAAEYLCAAYASQHGWNLSVARCFSFVGPFMPMDLHYAIGDFIQHARRGAPIIIKGDGTPVRSYLYAADLVVWLLALLTRPGGPRIYNVGSDVGITLAELAQRVRETINPGSEIRILGQTAYSVGNPVRTHYLPSIDRARDELGLGVWTPLDQAIKRTAGACATPPEFP